MLWLVGIFGISIMSSYQENTAHHNATFKSVNYFMELVQLLSSDLDVKVWCKRRPYWVGEWIFATWWNLIWREADVTVRQLMPLAPGADLMWLKDVRCRVCVFNYLRRCIGLSVIGHHPISMSLANPFWKLGWSDLICSHQDPKWVSKTINSAGNVYWGTIFLQTLIDSFTF